MVLFSQLIDIKNKKHFFLVLRVFYTYFLVFLRVYSDASSLDMKLKFRQRIFGDVECHHMRSETGHLRMCMVLQRLTIYAWIKVDRY